jgi:hypothetical protein
VLDWADVAPAAMAAVTKTTAIIRSIGRSPSMAE